MRSHDFVVFAEEKLQNRLQKPFVPYQIGERGGTEPLKIKIKQKTAYEYVATNSRSSSCSSTPKSSSTAALVSSKHSY